jgi:pimeloyl-ACP methyl ester carboxylesterase
MTSTPVPELPITFVIPGIRIDGVSRGGGADTGLPLLAALGGDIKASVQVERRRAGGDAHRIQALPGEDVVVLHLDQGPPLVLHPSTARDLLLAQSKQLRAVSRGSAGDPVLEVGPHEVEVSPQLGWNGMESAALVNPGAKRGGLGDVVLKVIEVVGLKGRAQELVASALAQKLDDRVNEGVYALQPERLTPLKVQTPVQTMETAKPGAAVLVFVHGTFSTTCESGFANLWSRHPQLVASLFSHYNNHVYALDHATLGKTPIENALTLVRACPPDTRLHLITHSRGGLVAEVLARSAALTQLDDAGEELFAQQGWQTQRDHLKELIQLMQERRISVDRTVRVACPARGTLLASQRLDAYVSILRWALSLAGISVVAELVDFLAGVARERTDPNTMPGLAVMAPDSPLISWLHAAKEVVPGELRVVAGDLQGDSIGSWTKTLMADSFFWTDNDLVVQTRSMYGGAPRKAIACFRLDRSGDSSHFNYFTNAKTANAIVSGLIENNPQDWSVIGPLSFAGLSSDGSRGTFLPPVDRLAAADKPAVIVLPGILGSHLKVGDHRVWLSWSLFNGFKLLDYPDGKRIVKPDGPIGITYDGLMNFLASSHEVIPFSYDWRKPMEEEARRLGVVVDAALEARAKSGQPVRLLAHSMGGLLARAMQIECGSIWDRMMAHKGARLLMLGTPNEGSWAPMQVLSGDDSFGNTITAVGAPFQDKIARATMARFPGFLQLQASLLDSPQGLNTQEGWQKLADGDLNQISACSWWHQDRRQLDNARWGVPTNEVLAEAVRFWEKLHKQRDQDLPRWRDKLAMVVGSAPFTAVGFGIDEQGEFAYQETQDSGDGRVTHASAMLPGVRTWKLDADHGSLPATKIAFAAFKELLETGETNLLSPFQSAGVSRGLEKPTLPIQRRSRPSRQGGSSLPRGNDDNLYNLGVDDSYGLFAPGDPPLAIKVRNGNLKFVRQALLIGHYTSSTLTGTEAVVDKLIGGTLADALAMGCYPDWPESHQVFANCSINRDNPLQPARPEAVVVVGLGEEGKLSSVNLVSSVQKAVMAYAQQRMEQSHGIAEPFVLSATLLGSGGSGIDAGQSAQLVAQGVREANKLLKTQKNRPWPSVSALELVELYLDRASIALNALQLQAEAQPGIYTINSTVVPGVGAERRPPDWGYRGTEHDFISALTGRGSGEGTGGSEITYTIDSKRARTEIRAQSTQRRLVEQLVAKASNERGSDIGIGRTLFKLLVPLQMEPIMAGTSAMVIELDQGSAPIPWEMLDTDSGKSNRSDQRPWAIRTKLLRKLQLADFRQQPKDSRQSSPSLIIGEPLCDAAWPRLPGARQEARAVFEKLKGGLGEDNVVALISAEDSDDNRPDAIQVINTLMSEDWRIIHISGHGDLPDNDDPHGVVLSDGLYLGPREIQTMRVVPELVFVNCCHLAATGADQVFNSYNRTKFAASVAEQLIKNGVRCVVAAGWAVGDRASETFAEKFYYALLNGQRFIDAIALAREAVWQIYGKQDKTWAAYQCYGDPDWILKSSEEDPQMVSTTTFYSELNIVSASSLILALESIKNKASSQGDDNQYVHQQLQKLESKFANLWGKQGEVARAFAIAWDAANHKERAIEWFQQAISAEDGGASLNNLAQMSNIKLRQALKKLVQARDENSTENPSPVSEEKYKQILRESRDIIQHEAESLQQLVTIAPTMELLCLCGSAQKRRAMLERMANDSVAEKEALEAMKSWYLKAEEYGIKSSINDVFYATINRMAADCVLKAGETCWSGFEPGDLNRVHEILSRKVQDDPDFWGLCGVIELEIYEVLANCNLRLADRIVKIITDLRDLYGRVRDPGPWQSLGDQMELVLRPYIIKKSEVDPAEAEAATSLLEVIHSFIT